jgi:microcystin-dependent protein
VFSAKQAGSKRLRLQSIQLPAHNRTALAATTDGIPTPGGNAWGGALKGVKWLYAPSGTNGFDFSERPHNNLCPYLTL